MSDASVEQYQRESLDAYLDWPVEIDEDWIICNNPECPACRGTVGITKWYGLTPRRLCEAVKRHVGDAHRA